MPLDGVGMGWEERLAPAIERWRAFLLHWPSAKATVDFETRSEYDLRRHGSYRYSRHPTTEAMCLAYKLPGYDRFELWHMAHPQHLIAESDPPEDLFAFVLAGGLVEAHNSFFERMIWKHIMVARRGWPAVRHEQWRCSAAKASAASLPRPLEDACLAMRLPVEKDMVGHRLMRKMTKPRKMLKAEIKAWCEENGWTGRPPGRDSKHLPVVWHEAEEDLYRLWAYCRQDGAAEEGLSEAVPDLDENELRVWQMDQRMNERGVRFDLDMARAALTLASAFKGRLNGELAAMTGISSATQRAAVKDWLAVNEGVDLPDTAGATLDWIVGHEPDLSGRARRVMQIMREVNRTSTRKYQSMLDHADPDDWRVRDLLMFHGAGTGRWSGKGVQVHNFPARDLIVRDFVDAADVIKSGDVDWCIAMYGDVMKLLSHALRGAIIPSDGREMMVADYSAIEARVVLWLADASGALDVFRSGGDIYCDMATGIYGYDVTKANKTERQFGKQSILGLGYGMGFVTFLLTCRKYGIVFSREDVVRIMGERELLKMEAWVRNYLWLDAREAKTESDKASRRQAVRVRRRLEEERELVDRVVHELALMKHTVNIYRGRYPEVKAMWKAQEEAAMGAVRSGGAERTVCGRVTWYVENGFLYCELPCGRRLSYRDPIVKEKMTSWGERRPHLSYMSVNGVTKKWERTGTYGGKVVENITQAVARDIMANAMLLADEGGVYDTVMSVHDELVCEVDADKGSVDDFERLMSSIPFWAAGCPVAAEAERMSRYKK